MPTAWSLVHPEHDHSDVPQGKWSDLRARRSHVHTLVLPHVAWGTFSKSSSLHLTVRMNVSRAPKCK